MLFNLFSSVSGKDRVIFATKEDLSGTPNVSLSISLDQDEMPSGE